MSGEQACWSPAETVSGAGEQPSTADEEDTESTEAAASAFGFFLVFGVLVAVAIVLALWILNWFGGP